MSDVLNLVDVLVDGTDFQIQEPRKFDHGLYPHKFRSAVLRNEVGLCLETSSIVWIHRQFPARGYSEKSIFNLKMVHCLDRNEKLLGDRK